MEYARESSSVCEGRVRAFAYLLHDELLGLTEQLAREHNHGRGAVSDLSNDREWSERPGVRDQNFGSEFIARRSGPDDQNTYLVVLHLADVNQDLGRRIVDVD